MTTLEEIESAVERLSLPEQEALLRFLVMRFKERISPTAEFYSTRPHQGSVRDGIDPDKLGQLPDDF